MKGSVVIAAVKRKLRVYTDTALAHRLGMSIRSIQGWKKRPSVTPRQLAELIYRANRAGATNFKDQIIRPLVEFYPIERTESRQRANFELFATKEAGGKEHPYRAGLRAELADHHGVYVFFDSRGQAIYAGKARRRSLWEEMKSAFNRERGGVQRIKRVKHPARKQPYRNSDEKDRQITDNAVPLHELAAYMSAYHVADGMIDDLEALLVRSFANDLLNVRMERFVRQRRRTR